jgi:hypothetical protein
MVGTGYSGNGVTFGTVAARVLADIVATRVNPCAELYAPTRPLGARQWAKYAAQNLPAAWTLVTDMLPLPASSSIDDPKPGEGRLLRIGGEKAAAARDRNGGSTSFRRRARTWGVRWPGTMSSGHGTALVTGRDTTWTARYCMGPRPRRSKASRHLPAQETSVSIGLRSPCAELHTAIGHEPTPKLSYLCSSARDAHSFAPRGPDKQC